MFSTADTIVAVATPPGRGGIGVVRLSGPSALAIGARLARRSGALEPRRATLCTIQLPDASGVAHGEIDHAVVTAFPAPGSYSGEDVVEISAHGSPVVLHAILEAAVYCGARLAEPGEFTLRAYLNGRIDLVQAEAIADLIDAATPLQARVAFDQLQGTLTRAIGEIYDTLFDLMARLEASVDFPDEGYHFADPMASAVDIGRLMERTDALIAQGRRGRLIREGIQVAIVGPPNAGKSSLFNALVGADRAIVTDVPGTTRDLVTEVADIGGIRATLVDTAGLRTTSDVVEKEGVIRAVQATRLADLVLFVADRSAPFPASQWVEVVGHQPKNAVVLIGSKSDLPHEWSHEEATYVSATSGIGIDLVRDRIAGVSDSESLRDQPLITNARHLALLDRARLAMNRAKQALSDGPALSEEFVLADLQEARSALEEVTGRRTSDDVLAHIFERFCIGK